MILLHPFLCRLWSAGYKIPMIESLGATKDAYDCIDLSDNEIQKFENFPYLTRLTMLLLNNNRITKIEEDLGKSLPHLDTLMLTNNYIASLSEVDALASFTKVTCLSLLHNPVTRRQHYRFYVIHKLPQLKELDFRKVKPEERIQAEKLFKTNAGKQLEQAINKVRDVVHYLSSKCVLHESSKRTCMFLFRPRHSHQVKLRKVEIHPVTPSLTNS